MNSWIKISIMIIFLLSIIGVGYFYVTLNGNPIKKPELKEEANRYLEEKYNEEMVVEKSTYDMNIGYGARAYPKNKPEHTFQMYRKAKGEWRDYYPRTVWKHQLQKDIMPIMNKIYPEADKKIIATFNQEYNGNVLPNYKTTDYSFMGNIIVPEAYSDKDENRELNKIYFLIQFWKNHDLKGGLKISYEDRFFRFNKKEIEKIEAKKDLNVFLILAKMLC